MPYDDIRYVGQEFHSAVKRMFRDKGGLPPIKHNETLQESWISYSVLGLEASLHIIKRGNGYHLVTMVGEKGAKEMETRFDSDIKLKRSKEGRINPNCLDKFAADSLVYLKEYHRTRQPKQ